MMFTFLWTGKKIKEGIHLGSWNQLAKPKNPDGWGIKALRISILLGKP